uniref:SGNH/GDSL hydrolase family protein n=1 Tax=Acidobacterium capsulatum TaxID=33075 RepID=A0A7V5CSC4_9BACT
MRAGDFSKKDGIVKLLRRISCGAFWIALASLTSMAVAQTPRNLHWTDSWAASPMQQTFYTSNTAFHDTTVREIVHLSRGGHYIRVRLSNVFGTEPLHITSVHVAAAVATNSSEIVAGTDTPVTFEGSADVLIPPGAAYVSDPVAFDAKPLENLTISFHLNQPSMPETTHDNSNQVTFMAPGDQVGATQLTDARSELHWYWLTGVEVGTPQPGSCVVAFGDSITDGWQSTVNGNNRWPDDLAARLQANAATKNVCVINEGISGNRVLLDGSGPNAMSRFDRDVLSQPGAKYVIVLEAINDIGHLADQQNVSKADQDAFYHHLIAGYQEMIDQAHAHGIKIIGATLTPFKGCGYYTAQGPEFEAMRQKINTWIRTPGHFDAYVDFDKVTRDPAQPDRFAPEYDSGDHLHPNPAGYKAMANAIPLTLFEK